VVRSMTCTPDCKSIKAQYGQKMLHGDLQRLYYDLDDMNTLTPKILNFKKG
jgi:hypothetical protein